jgi:serine/threonine protein kinase
MLRVGDFSLSQGLADMDVVNRGRGEELEEPKCLPYTAPELLMDQAVTGAVDIWSIGVLFFEIVTGRLPFENSHKGRLAQKILRDDPAFPSTMSEPLRDLIGRMLTKDPSQRITLENVKQHPWVLKEGIGAPLSLNLDQLEELRTGSDLSREVVDEEIVESVEALGLDVSHLTEQLLNDVHCDATCAYRQFLRREITAVLVDIVPGLLVKEMHSRWYRRGDAISRRRSLPRFEPKKIAILVKPRTVASVCRNEQQRRVVQDVIKPQCRSRDLQSLGRLVGYCLPLRGLAVQG